MRITSVAWATMLTLYFAPGSSSFAVHIALHEIGVAFDAKPMSFKKDDLRSAGLSQAQPGGQGPGTDHRWPPADRGRGYPVLSGKTFSRCRTVAAERHRGRRAGAIMDVLHRFNAASGTPARTGPCQKGLGNRRPAPGQWLGAEKLFDRRYPSVSAVLAVRQFAEADARDLSQPHRA